MRDELDEVIDGCEAVALAGATLRPFTDDEREKIRAGVSSARSIRDRERKLAGLATEMGTILTNIRYEMGGHFDREINPDLADWLRRYEETLK